MCHGVGIILLIKFITGNNDKNDSNTGRVVV